MVHLIPKLETVLGRNIYTVYLFFEEKEEILNCSLFTIEKLPGIWYVCKGSSNKLNLTKN